MSHDATPNPDPEIIKIIASTASATGDANVASPAAISRTLARHPRPLGGDTARSTLGTASLSLTGMVLDNQSSTHQMRVGRKPDWLRAKVPGGERYLKLKSLINEHQLHTVCQEASCPNMGECWDRGTATIMILGDTCTRSCGFCNVKTGKPMPVDDDEPRRVAEALAQIGLKHVVITSVDRDDQPDGGARIWAETIQAVHEACPETSVEVLVGDFKGVERDIQIVCDARPEIISHNMETVNRMHPAVRPQARYNRSLKVLQQFKANGLVTKTGIMLGIGEHEREVLKLLDDVRAWSDCDIITIGQYLQPTRNHLPIDRWVHPDEFARLRDAALEKGFEVCESGPLVRSSYHAEEQAEKLSPERADVHGRMKKLISQARERDSG
ncbi:MAG: lipoyl synthase [Phycisphaerales bacterium]|nr:lipoyl synthase [Phycisphaerales bacterium]